MNRLMSYRRITHRRSTTTLLDWGVTITTKELEEFGNKYGLRSTNPNVPLTVPECGAVLTRTIKRFNKRHGLGVRAWTNISFPVSKEPVVLLKVLTNYGTGLSPDAVLDLCEDVETSFGKRGKWYISDTNKSFCDDYYISLPKKKKAKKTMKSTSAEDVKSSE
ncbi:hypothetical protein L218DRAFT_676933 [Marasmius fiardii PR-910]|nr:hypothetical protein L218DRAFT_676933 [Marasmius fiardii PR-910]